MLGASSYTSRYLYSHIAPSTVHIFLFYFILFLWLGLRTGVKQKRVLNRRERLGYRAYSLKMVLGGACYAHADYRDRMGRASFLQDGHSRATWVSSVSQSLLGGSNVNEGREAGWCGLLPCLEDRLLGILPTLFTLCSFPFS
ncbi:hypothetical protein SODALDRAFT_95703 [Sodiomyces alkalinus F11]|uniref:Uncharacterized protein n=1 Tax=Sodiomyces alkalinus (strain CBS 110278 / VKM F-3762 / F11) TaxID=1314773 RepID=A0A3N2Q0Y6_SODAK|nr:hypothetical protein SODALDRAFT_95703 [Sodiomyces alkalinus F11]ROT40400.1 hypothetical protein SODALDRAFT_95703 [Sodiomyces alkalinus F11]